MGTIAENGIINLMRGDSFTTPLRVNLGSKLNPIYYTLTSRDRLYFGLMEPNQAFEDAVVRKVFDWTSPTDAEGNVLLTLTPRDTEHLLVGQYYYMVKLRSFDIYGQESVRTIIPPTIFWLNGNNPAPDIEYRYETEDYDVDHVIIEGGEYKSDDSQVIFEGGEII